LTLSGDGFPWAVVTNAPLSATLSSTTKASRKIDRII
jgi:hypothetical protein